MKKSIYLILAVSILTTMCEMDDVVIGKGELVDNTIELSSFNKISIEGQASVSVAYGDTQKVTITAQQNIFEAMNNHVSNGKLFIDYKEHTSVQSSKGIIVKIISPTAITDFSVDGSGDLIISGKPQDVFNTEINGSGSVNAYDLEVCNVSISIDGSGNCKVKATKTLDVEINGSGTVSYKGSPKVTQSISGSGSLKDAN